MAEENVPVAKFKLEGSKTVGVSKIQQTSLTDQGSSLLAGGVNNAFGHVEKGTEAVLGGFIKEREDLTVARIAEGDKAFDLFEERVNTGRFGMGTEVDGVVTETRDDVVNRRITQALGDGAEPEAIRRTTATFNSLAQAYEKNGRSLLSKADLGIAMNARLTELINDNPAFKEDIIKKATEILGFDPTHSRINQRLAALKAKPASSLSAWEKDVADRIRMGASPEMARANATKSFKVKEQLKTNQLMDDQDELTVQHINSSLPLHTSMIDMDIDSMIRLRRQAGTLTEQSLKDTFLEDSNSIRKLYERSRTILRQQSRGRDISKTISALDKEMENDIAWLEDRSFIKRKDRQNELWKAFTTAQMDEAFPDFQFVQQAMPGFAPEYWRLYAQTKGDPTAIANAEAGNPEFAGTRALLKVFHDRAKYRRKIIEGGKAAGGDRELATVDASLMAASSESDADTANAFMQVLNNPEGAPNDLLTTLDSDKVQAGLSKKARSSQIAANTVLNEYRTLTAKLAPLEGENVFVIDKNGEINFYPKEYQGGSEFTGVASSMKAKALVARINKLIAVNNRYQFDKEITPYTFATKKQLPPTEQATITGSGEKQPLVGKGEPRTPIDFRSPVGEFIGEGIAKLAERSQAGMSEAEWEEASKDESLVEEVTRLFNSITGNAPAKKQPPVVDYSASAKDLGEIGNKAFDAVAQVETGGDPDPSIRTKVRPPKGSSAYGPVQVTRNLVRDLTPAQLAKFTPEEQEYFKRFVAQGTEMLRDGNEADPVYGYGGTGVLTSPEDRAMYYQTMSKLFEIVQRGDYSPEAIADRWYNSGNTAKDAKYAERLRKAGL